MIIEFDASFFVFFFQAEDGIRDDLVTGVQTCALPIFWLHKLHQSVFATFWAELTTISLFFSTEKKTKFLPPCGKVMRKISTKHPNKD